MNRTVTALALGLGLGVSAVLLPQQLGGSAVAAPATPAAPALSYDPSVSLAPLVEAHGAAVVNLEVVGGELRVGVDEPLLGWFPGPRSSTPVCHAGFQRVCRRGCR